MEEPTAMWHVVVAIASTNADIGHLELDAIVVVVEGAGLSLS